MSDTRTTSAARPRPAPTVSSPSDPRVGALGKITGALGGIAGPLAGAFAVGQVVDFGKENSAKPTYTKKASTVFEGGADLVRAWADQNNEAMGLSKEKLTGLAAGSAISSSPWGSPPSRPARCRPRWSGSVAPSPRGPVGRPPPPR